jgi:hypothetical protein
LDFGFLISDFGFILRINSFYFGIKLFGHELFVANPKAGIIFWLGLFGVYLIARGIPGNL